MKKFGFNISDINGEVFLQASEYAEDRHEALEKLLAARWDKKDKKRLHHIDIYEIVGE